MRRALPVLIAVAVLAVAAPAQAHHVEFTPAYAGGKTPSQLLGDIWVGSLSGQHIPYRGTCTTYVRTVVVAHPPLEGGPISCTMSHQQSLLFLWGAFCASWEEDVGWAPAAQLRCAVDADRIIRHVEVSVDGGRPFDIVRPRFEFATPQRFVHVAEGNDFGIPPVFGSFTAHGYAALLKGLEPRRRPYSIVRTVTMEGFDPFSQELCITVTR
jgi:hypothetical protein